MDADTLALQLQQQLHEQNQSRFKEIENRLGDVEQNQKSQGETLARIEENTKAIPHLGDRVDDLEKTDSKHKGALGVLSLLWAGLLGLVEWKSRG